MSDKTGGPAFPVFNSEGIVSADTGENLSGAMGLTARDYFAAKAMNGFYSGAQSLKTRDEDLAEDAKLFYRIADAMLKARGEQ